MSYLRATSGASPLECAQLATVMHYAKVDVYLIGATASAFLNFRRAAITESGILK